MLKGYKTLLFSALLALVPVLEMAEVFTLIPEEYHNVYMIGVATMTALLRVATTTPVGKK
jgi:hypothetical protein